MVVDTGSDAPSSRAAAESGELAGRLLPSVEDFSALQIAAQFGTSVWCLDERCAGWPDWPTAGACMEAYNPLRVEFERVME